MKKFPGVSEKEDYCPTTEVIEDGPEARHDDEMQEQSDEEDEYVPQSNVDDVRHIKRGLGSDWPKNIQKGGAPNSNEKKKGDGSTIKEAGEDNTSRVEHQDRSELSMCQFLSFDDKVPSHLPPGYEEASVVVEDVDKQLI